MTMKKATLMYTEAPNAETVRGVMLAFRNAVKDGQETRIYMGHEYTFPAGHMESFPGAVGIDFGSNAGGWEYGVAPKCVAAFVCANFGAKDVLAKAVVFDPEKQGLEVEATAPVLRNFAERLRHIGGVQLVIG